jgi:hypothetical protein
MSLYIRGDYFLKSYTVLKTALVYDKYKPSIYLAYAKIFMFFNQSRFYWSNYNEIATASLNQYVLMHYKARDITQTLEKHVLLRSHVWQVYVKYMHGIYLQSLLESLLDFSPSAPRFREFLVFQARRAASDLDILRIRSVLATERPPTRGWGLPKFHSQALIS